MATPKTSLRKIQSPEETTEQLLLPRTLAWKEMAGLLGARRSTYSRRLIIAGIRC
ncbi:translation initiation factor IF-2 [Paraburkholderia atlantica]|uniref:Translation initiation factor IF-2 n=1 Tax=Paraburkholderia atlantica TaxID=2654982 RepID=D5WI80_PARAM|nr:translation initiation factor IF-2 [Paraburkholderia atlantica]